MMVGQISLISTVRKAKSVSRFGLFEKKYRSFSEFSLRAFSCVAISCVAILAVLLSSVSANALTASPAVSVDGGVSVTWGDPAYFNFINDTFDTNQLTVELDGATVNTYVLGSSQSSHYYTTETNGTYTFNLTVCGSYWSGYGGCTTETTTAAVDIIPPTEHDQPDAVDETLPDLQFKDFVTAEIIGDNLVRVSWDVDGATAGGGTAEFAKLTGIPDGVVLPKFTYTGFNNSIPVTVEEGQVEFTASDWVSRIFNVSACRYVYTCNHQGCGDPNSVHPLQEECTLKQTVGVNSGYAFNNVPPTVAFVAPNLTTSYPLNQSISIQVDAADDTLFGVPNESKIVDRVELYLTQSSGQLVSSGTRIATLTTASNNIYSYNFTPTTPGTYYLVAVAYDTLEASASALQYITVQEESSTGAPILVDNTTPINFDRYASYYGDFDGDGLRDLYFHGLPLIILLHGDIVTPIVLPAPEGFAYFSGIDGSYGAVEAYAMTDESIESCLADGSCVVVTETQKAFGDFNSDGHDDLLIKSPDSDGSSVVISGTMGETPPQVLLEILASGHTQVPGQPISNIPVFVGNLYDSIVSIANGDLVVNGQNHSYSALTEVTSSEGASIAPNENIGEAPQAVLPQPSLNAAEIAEMDALVSIGGEFRVNEMGAATYTVPVNLPAGTAGVVPPISISYSSQSQSGDMGLGWQLSSGGAVSRCRQTLQVDKHALPIKFSNEDRFCLDGQRLLVVSSHSYGDVSAQYKPEIDSGVLVTSHGGSDGHPDYFTVSAKDGSTRTYGSGNNSLRRGRTATGSFASTSPNRHVMSWNVSEFKDSVGNKITYHYEDTEDHYRMSEVGYGYGNSSTAAVNVYFDYDTRKKSRPSWVSGVSFKDDSLLTAIRITDNGSAVNHYKLAYNNGVYVTGSDDFDRLTQLQYCAEGDYCNQPLEFTWGHVHKTVALDVSRPKRVAEYAASIITTQYATTLNNDMVGNVANNYYQGHVELDINGDGLPDVVTLSAAPNDTYRLYEYQQNSSGFNGMEYKRSVAAIAGDTDARLGAEAPTMQPIDINADGRSDLAVYVPNTGDWKLYVSAPQLTGEWQLQYVANFLPANLPDNVRFADLNSDGLADLFYSTSTQFVAHYLTKRTNETDDLVNASTRAYAFSASPDIQVSLANFDTYNFGGVVDLNQDGKVDVLAASITTTETTGAVTNEDNIVKTCTYDVAFNALLSSDNTFSQTTSIPFRSGSSEVALRYDESSGSTVNYLIARCTDEEYRKRVIGPNLVDINGDGLNDLVMAFAVPTYTTDHNHNSKKDPEYHFNTIQYRLGNPDFTFGSEQEISFTNDALGFQLMDLDSDEDQDIVLLLKDDYKRSIKWSGTSFSGTVQTLLSADVGRQTRYTDIDNDGLLDQVEVKDNEMTVKRGMPRYNNLITGIQSSIGAQTIVQYEPLNLSGAYVKLDGISATESDTLQDCIEPVYGNSQGGYCAKWRPRTVADATAFYNEINNPFANEDPNTNVCADKNVPAQEYISAMPVVTAVGSYAPTETAPNGLAVVVYKYEGLKIQAGGRGMLGFKVLTTTDMQTGVSTATEYRQDWPFIGSPKKTVSTTLSGQKLSESSSTMGLLGISAATIESVQATVAESGSKGLGSLVIYNAASRDITYDAPQDHLAMPGFETSSATSETVLREVVNTTTVDEWSNALTMESTTYGMHNNAWVAMQTQSTANTYFQGDGIRLGRLKQSIVTTDRVGAGSITKTADFTYYGYEGAPCGGSADLAGLLCSEQITVSDLTNSQAPHLAQHYYDAFGNKTFVKSGTRVSPLAQYDSRGRFPTSTYDVFAAESGESSATPDFAYSAPSGSVVVQTSEVISRSPQGAPLLSRAYIGNGQSVFSSQATSPLGVAYFKGDSRGGFEETRMRRAGTVGGSTISDANCPATAAVVATKSSAGGSSSSTCMDLAGRQIGSYATSFDGQMTRAETRYDSLGRAIAVSEPAKGVPSNFTQTRFDILGRPEFVTHTLFITNTLGVATADHATTSIAYDGFTITTTSSGVVGGSGDRVKTEVKNALGDLVSVTEQNERSITYHYDVLGNLEQVYDPAGNVSTITYNGLGQKIAMNDPDKGDWSYYYDSYGALTKQVDAKNQSTVIDYDFKGRKIASRSYASGVNSDSSDTSIEQEWQYDSAVNGLGQVARASDISEQHTQQTLYDTLGRVASTVTTMPNNQGVLERFYQSQTYDQYGRAHQAFDSARQGPQYSYNGTQNVYNQYGFLTKVVDAANDGAGALFYEVMGTDARGNVTLLQYGDGNQVSYVYDTHSGLLETIVRSGALGASQIYNATWDHLGNLVKRDDSFFGNKAETFSYDQHNRLLSNTLDGTTVSLSYNSIDNIVTKSDQQGGATYQYDPTKIHAVKTIGARALEYDANGNATSDGDKALSYSVKDQVKEIVTSTHTSRFNYGLGGGRFKRVDINSAGATTTTLYLGSVEKIFNSDGSIVWKRNIGGKAQVIYTQASNGALGTGTRQYFFHDHLDSLVAISNAVGVIQQRMAYDPWGARRTISNNEWQASAMSESSVLSAFAKVNKPNTNRGFTGHEMLDEVGIVHMNGRIYDATLGRFLQADPNIQSPTAVGSLNRYSYVMNNPLNATDPTGYFFKKLVSALFKATGLKSILTSIASNQILSSVVSIALNFIPGCQGWCSTVFAMATSFAVTGSLTEAFKAGIIADLSAAAFSGIGGESFGNTFGGGAGANVARSIAHGLVGGISSVLQGGKFGHGFASAGFTKFIDINEIVGIKKSLAGVRVAMASVVGGTISKMTGGKFANGAVTAAMGQLYSGEQMAGAERDAQKGRTPGKIYVAGHRVGKVGPYHTALEYDDGTGVQWISAGPEGTSLEGFEKLVGGVGNEVNGIRATDAPGLNKTLGVVTPPKGMSAGEYFNTLTTAAGNYSNSVDYDMFPGVSNSYNSNSYVSGLLSATGGASSVNMSGFVGGGKPLPKENFGY
jgi:RHS repeat-associated protein